MRVFEAATLTQLHDEMTRGLVTATDEELDIISTVDVAMTEVMGIAKSMDWEFDLKSMWLTKSRWSMMVRQYFDREDVIDWIQQITSRIGRRDRGIAVLRTKTVAARGGAATGHTNKETRRWGSCMLAVSYKALPTPTITLHSRTSYLGYIGALDLTCCWMLAKYLGAELGMSPKDFKFVWMIDSIQWHNFKSLAYLLNHPDKNIRKKYRALLIKKESKLDKQQLKILSNRPGLRLSRKWLAKVIAEDKAGKTYGDMTYNTYRRIRRRWHTEVLGYEKAQTFEGWSYYKVGDKAGEQKEFFKAYAPLPSVTVDTLDFGPIGLLPGLQYGEEFQGGGEEEDDDD